VTDGRTDRRTDGIVVASTALAKRHAVKRDDEEEKRKVRYMDKYGWAERNGRTGGENAAWERGTKGDEKGA